MGDEADEMNMRLKHRTTVAYLVSLCLRGIIVS
jgi:hypothetical protein